MRTYVPERSGVEPYAVTVRVAVGPGLAYWSVLAGPELTPVAPVDSFLRCLRLARRRSEGTTRVYAGHLKRFVQWRLSRDLSWEAAAGDLAGYVIWLRLNPRRSPGRGQGQVPSEAALGPALAAIHGFYWHAVDIGDVDWRVLRMLFENAIPQGSGGARMGSPRPRLRVDVRSSEPVNLGPPAATVEELAALLAAATTARDACLIGMMGGLGLRVGQVVSLRRAEVHLVPPGRRVPGCGYAYGPHVHVVKRDDHPRGATSKSRQPVVVPVAVSVEMLYAAWLRERRGIPGAGDCPWVFVSFPGPAGTLPGLPLSTRRVYAIVEGAARRAGLRHIHPHMLRHTFATTAADLDVARDVLQSLLGQHSVASQDVYRRPAAARLIEAATEVTSKLVGGDER